MPRERRGSPPRPPGARAGGALTEASELAPLGLHDARHTYVSLMHASGVALEEIGDYVGHSSTYMTDRYRHLIDGQREAAAARFDEYAEGQLAASARGPAVGQ